MLMKFAICDNDLISLHIQEYLIKQYLKGRSYDVIVDSFSSPLEFLSFINSLQSNPYKVIFLETKMGEISGLDVARRLRELDKTFYLVFVTGYPMYAEQAFPLHTFRFIRKSLFADQIEKVLEDIFDELNHTPSISFMSNRRIISIPIDDIHYIMGIRNGTLFVTSQGEYRSRMTLKDVASIARPPILRCQSGYFVNINYIDEVSNTTIRMKSGEEISIRSKYRTKFLADYSMFR